MIIRGRVVPEEWARIFEYPNYAVSNYGRVKNVKFDRFLKPRRHSSGHQRVLLTNSEGRRELYVHSLVAQYFLAGWEPDFYVFHHDGDPTNCKVNNLRFRKGTRLGQMLKGEPDIEGGKIEILETGEVFRNVTSLARYLETSPSSIYRVLRGERPKHLGYTFKRHANEY